MFLTVQWISQAAGVTPTNLPRLIAAALDRSAQICGDGAPTSPVGSVRSRACAGPAIEGLQGDGIGALARFHEGNSLAAGLGRASSRESGVRHATISNKRPASAHPLFSCCTGAERCRAALDHPQHGLTVASRGSRQDACRVRRRCAEILCWRRARQWGFTPMPARS